MPKHSWGYVVLMLLILLGSILYVAYGLHRHESVALLATYLLGFAAYIGLVLFGYARQHLKYVLAAALLLRCLLLPAVPSLSDDVYRFIWDGRLWTQGVHPFANTPSAYAEGQAALPPQGIDQELYQLLNSPDYFTIYPPVSQLVFAVVAALFPDSIIFSIVAIRLLILLAEGATLWLLWQLLQQAKLPVQRILWYALNPLVVLELSGNLHFEGVMLCFLLLSIYGMLQKNLWLMASSFALAICTKLLPLIFLPLYLRRLGRQKSLYFFGLTGLVTVLLFLPLFNQNLVHGMTQSIGLYFQKFEFNASIYYIVREIGYIRKGYNIIATAGLWLAATTFVSILLYAYWEKQRHLGAAFLWVMLIYLLLSTTVHPWYIIPLIAFSLFTPYRFAMVWSLLIFFSYAGYSASGFEEILWLTTIEYVAVLGWLGYEWYHHRQAPGDGQWHGNSHPELYQRSFIDNER